MTSDSRRRHAASDAGAVGDIQIDVQESPDAETVQQLVRRLVASNDLVAPPEHHKRLAVFATDNGELVGGASGYTHWDWLFVSHLWVDEARRHHGLGSTLMGEIEEAAARRGARAAHLDTYDFQALGFYQARGYRIFGQLDDYPPGHTRYFLTRELPTVHEDG